MCTHIYFSKRYSIKEGKLHKREPPVRDETRVYPPGCIFYLSKHDSSPPTYTLEPEPMLESECEPTPKAVDARLANNILTLETEPEPTPTPVEVTVEELYSTCKLFNASMDAILKGKILKVTGVVVRIVAKYGLSTSYIPHDSDMLYDSYILPDSRTLCTPHILLISGDKYEYFGVRCIFSKKYESKLPRLSKGQTVTVQGKYDCCLKLPRLSKGQTAIVQRQYAGYTINVLVKDCVLV